ncbi:MAG: CBS domain-containing protein [Gammaproteobacteria bacterium]|nr:CBS domain-containing protein [Gammaproteobacteria bacterium]
MTVGRVCNRDVVVTRAEDSLRSVAQLMREYHIGDVVVVEERDGATVPVGIVTDRDLVVEVIAAGVAPDALGVGDVMSFELVTAHEEDSLWDTLQRMRVNAVRRIPVVDGRGALVGLLTLDDLLELLAGELMDLARVAGRRHDRRPHPP